jgi:hypothetical protein
VLDLWPAYGKCIDCAVHFFSNLITVSIFVPVCFLLSLLPTLHWLFYYILGIAIICFKFLFEDRVRMKQVELSS